MSTLGAESHDDERPNEKPAIKETVNLPSEKILDYLRTVGAVTVLREPADPERLVVCLKQDHGSVAEHAQWLAEGSIETMQHWIQHQNEIVRIGLGLETEHPNNVHYLIEVKGRGEVIAREKIEDRESQEKIFQRGVDDTSVATNLCKAVAEHEYNIGLRNLLAQMGMTRLMFSLVAKDDASRLRIHGLQYAERETYIRIREKLALLGDICNLRQAFMQDLQTIHTLATEQIKNNVLPGQCALIVLGGKHFATGTDIESLLAFDETPRNIQDLMLDTHLASSPELRDALIVVLEPTHFPR